jgi:hypothetical protein
MSNNTLTVGTNVNTPMDFNTDNSLPDLSNQKGTALTMGMWGISPAVVKEMANINRVYSSKHGMFSSIPILCKGPDCAYKDVCMVTTAQRNIGQRCPMEIAAILARYEQWCAHFEIDTSEDVLEAKDLVDATLIKDLVNVEIQILRAENKVALNGDFMADTLLDIDKKCQPYFGKIISPETEFLMTLQDKKIKILNQLNSTRKDKAADKRKESASDEAIKIFQQLKELQQARKVTDISDLDFDDDGNIKVEEVIIENDIVNDTLKSGGGDYVNDEKNGNS